jgi:hypothetical protein
VAISSVQTFESASLKYGWKASSSLPMRSARQSTSSACRHETGEGSVSSSSISAAISAFEYRSSAVKMLCDPG